MNQVRLNSEVAEKLVEQFSEWITKCETVEQLSEFNINRYVKQKDFIKVIRPHIWTSAFDFDGNPNDYHIVCLNDKGLHFIDASKQRPIIPKDCRMFMYIEDINHQMPEY